MLKIKCRITWLICWLSSDLIISGILIWGALAPRRRRLRNICQIKHYNWACSKALILVFQCKQMVLWLYEGLFYFIFGNLEYMVPKEILKRCGVEGELFSYIY